MIKKTLRLPCNLIRARVHLSGFRKPYDFSSSLCCFLSSNLNWSQAVCRGCFSRIKAAFEKRKKTNPDRKNRKNSRTHLCCAKTGVKLRSGHARRRGDRPMPFQTRFTPPWCKVVLNNSTPRLPRFHFKPKCQF